MNLSIANPVHYQAAEGFHHGGGSMGGMGGATISNLDPLQQDQTAGLAGFITGNNLEFQPVPSGDHNLSSKLIWAAVSTKSKDFFLFNLFEH